MRFSEAALLVNASRRSSSFIAEVLEKLQETAGERAENNTRRSRRRGLHHPGGLLPLSQKGQPSNALMYLIWRTGNNFSFSSPTLLTVRSTDLPHNPQLAWWEKRLLKKKNKAVLEIQRVYRAHR